MDKYEIETVVNKLADILADEDSAAIANDLFEQRFIRVDATITVASPHRDAYVSISKAAGKGSDDIYHIPQGGAERWGRALWHNCTIKSWRSHSEASKVIHKMDIRTQLGDNFNYYVVNIYGGIDHKPSP